MTEALNKAQEKFLLKEGDVVYISGNKHTARSSTPKAEVYSVLDEKIINFYMENHGKIVTKSDSGVLSEVGQGVYKPVLFDSGTRGIVISHFWSKIEKRSKNEENTDIEDAEQEVEYQTNCLLLIDDAIVLAPFGICTKIVS